MFIRYCSLRGVESEKKDYNFKYLHSALLERICQDGKLCWSLYTVPIGSHGSSGVQSRVDLGARCRSRASGTGKLTAEGKGPGKMEIVRWTHFDLYFFSRNAEARTGVWERVYCIPVFGWLKLGGGMVYFSSKQRIVLPVAFFP